MPVHFCTGNPCPACGSSYTYWQPAPLSLTATEYLSTYPDLTAIYEPRPAKRWLTAGARARARRRGEKC